MGTIQESDTEDSKPDEIRFALYYKSVLLTESGSRLPFVLAEAMVNHKKMVHPPCAG